MAKKRKLKLKRKAKIVFIVLILLIILGGVGTKIGLDYYQDYLYKQTQEYKALQVGYTLEEYNFFKEKINEEQIDVILKREKDDILIPLFHEKYFLYKNLDAYYEYLDEEEEKDLTKVVAIVNTHANHKWYTYDLDSDTSLNEKMIINKFYKLKDDYVPQNTKVIGLNQSYGKEGDNLLIDYAYDKFEELWDSAYEAGFKLMVTSSYRSYKDQEEIYDYRKKTQGEKKADQTAARPGHSEHQTGLVIDMTSIDAPYDEDFSKSKAYQWLKDNAYKYGWIERYPEDKTYLTGYSPESWHWRYVGVEAAKIIQEENITYDEYYAYYIEK